MQAIASGNSGKSADNLITKSGNVSDNSNKNINYDDEKAKVFEEKINTLSASSPCLPSFKSVPPSGPLTSLEPTGFCSPTKIPKLSLEAATLEEAHSDASQSDKLEIPATTEDGESQSGSHHTISRWSLWRETSRSITDSADPQEDSTFDENSPGYEEEPGYIVNDSDETTFANEGASQELVSSINSLSSLSEADASATQHLETVTYISKSASET